MNGASVAMVSFAYAKTFWISEKSIFPLPQYGVAFACPIQPHFAKKN